MDPVIIVVLVLVVLTLSGWGYGYRLHRADVRNGSGPRRGRWVHPLGAIGLVLAAVLVVLLLTGWRPV